MLVQKPLKIYPNAQLLLKSIKDIQTGYTFMRELLIDALLYHAKGKINKHKANVEIYLNSPVGIGEHSDVMESIEVELNEMAKYHEQVSVIEEYFLKEKEWPKDW